MSKISINLLRWSTPWDEVEQSISAVLNSGFKDFSLTYTENPHDSVPSLMEKVQLRFGHDLRIKTIRNQRNTGYAGAHNQFFAENNSELLMVLNPDAVIDPSFLQSIDKAFSDPRVGAATGKMLKPKLLSGDSDEEILDGTGIEVYRSRRARERGQLERDHGQYDQGRDVFGVSGTAAVYRKSALERARLGETEYFDVDFFAYWEDFDLSWRLRLSGYACVYVPEAIVEHVRAVGVSPGGMRNFPAFIRHHRSFPLLVRQWSWRNHLFAIIKNDFGWGFYRDLPKIVLREVGMLLFLLCFMPDTLSSVPAALHLLPRMLRKRTLIQSSRSINSSDLYKFFK
jgi:GT2 family glycosyltransferase